MSSNVQHRLAAAAASTAGAMTAPPIPALLPLAVPLAAKPGKAGKTNDVRLLPNFDRDNNVSNCCCHQNSLLRVDFGLMMTDKAKENQNDSDGL